MDKLFSPQPPCWTVLRRWFIRHSHEIQLLASRNNPTVASLFSYPDNLFSLFLCLTSAFLILHSLRAAFVLGSSLCEEPS